MKDDAVVIEQARQGDREAFERLLRRYQQEIRAYAVRIAPRLDLADDLAQEVFIVAFDMLKEYQGTGGISQWLRGIARNVARMQWRKLAQQQRIERDGLAEFVEALADNRAPDEALLLGEQVAAMRQCLEKLSPRARQLVEMRHLRGLTSQEIAEFLCAKASSVRTALTRIHEKLRECVEQRLKPVAPTGWRG